MPAPLSAATSGFRFLPLAAATFTFDSCSSNIHIQSDRHSSNNRTAEAADTGGNGGSYRMTKLALPSTFHTGTPGHIEQQSLCTYRASCATHSFASMERVCSQTEPAGVLAYRIRNRGTHNGTTHLYECTYVSLDCYHHHCCSHCQGGATSTHRTDAFQQAHQHALQARGHVTSRHANCVKVDASWQ